jgi:hypothetical protein
LDEARDRDPWRDTQRLHASWTTSLADEYTPESTLANKFFELWSEIDF